MIPYRRNLAIESGSLSLLATDVTVGDVILIRRPGAIERTAETVTGVRYLGNRVMAIRIDGYTHVTSTDMRVGIAAFTSGTWRQWDPTGLL